MKSLFLLVTISLLISQVTQAQTFNSGSTGADGALDLSAGDRVVQLPESGILNYTTVNVPTGKTLKFAKNFRNTSVILLAQGTVKIDGTIDLSASGQESGPGGFNGGPVGANGLGPGGGTAGSRDGKWIGSLSLVPNIGGSGSYGPGCGYVGYPPGVGGGGGGAITIASSNTVTISTGAITANGVRDSGCTSNSYGAAGAIRIIADEITVNGNLSASVVRLEASSGKLFYNGSGTSPVLSLINQKIVPSNETPSLRIVSIGGFTVPNSTASKVGAVDLLLPRQMPDPIPVIVQGSNIPVGTQVKINVSSLDTALTGTLAGSSQSSSTTINVSGLDKGGAVSYLYAYVVFTLPQSAQNFNLKGKDQIAQVRVETAPGAKPKYIFLRYDGTEIERQKVPAAILEQFGEVAR